MDKSELLKHLHNINLSYLLLAQRLIKDEKALATPEGRIEAVKNLLAKLTEKE